MRLGAGSSHGPGGVRALPLGSTRHAPGAGPRASRVRLGRLSPGAHQARNPGALRVNRGSWADIFWFSLFHELGHILLHDKRHIFLEDGLDDPSWQKQEGEADDFAQRTLIPATPYRSFVKTGRFSATRIASFADEIDIAPGIVVGRLQHDGLLSLNHHIHRARYKWAS